MRRNGGTAELQQRLSGENGGREQGERREKVRYYGKRLWGKNRNYGNGNGYGRGTAERHCSRMEERLGRFDSEALTKSIIGAAMEAHSIMGPGLLETAYHDALCYELEHAALPFERQPSVAYMYKTIRIDRVFRPDVIVKSKVILELKSVEKLLPIHDAQLQTYLKITGLKTGLIFNFNTRFLKDGIRRIDIP